MRVVKIHQGKREKTRREAYVRTKTKKENIYQKQTTKSSIKQGPSTTNHKSIKRVINFASFDHRHCIRIHQAKRHK